MLEWPALKGDDSEFEGGKTCHWDWTGGLINCVGV